MKNKIPTDRREKKQIIIHILYKISEQKRKQKSQTVKLIVQFIYDKRKLVVTETDFHKFLRNNTKT